MKDIEDIKLEWQKHNRDHGLSWNEVAELVNQVIEQLGEVYVPVKSESCSDFKDQEFSHDTYEGKYAEIHTKENGAHNIFYAVRLPIPLKEEPIRSCEGCIYNNVDDSLCQDCGPDYKLRCTTPKEEPKDSGWISVEDRLPELHESVIISKPSDFPDKVYVGWLSENGRWFEEDGPGGIADVEVCHWMPLPDPPKVETKKD
jgi:hypothetical protein